jgi:hypothetical protein
VHIGLDSYDDIFSDFDPSPYPERLLSEDFVIEARRRCSVTRKGGLELRFSLPKKMRNQKTESLIKRRIKQYFRGKVKDLEEEMGKGRRVGAVYFGAGFLVLLFAGLAPQLEWLGWAAHFLEILLVPVGWFGMFDGVELMVEAPRRYAKDLDYNGRLAGADYTFFSEEDLVESIAKAEEEKKREKQPGEKAAGGAKEAPAGEKKAQA